MPIGRELFWASAGKQCQCVTGIARRPDILFLSFLVVPEKMMILVLNKQATLHHVNILERELALGQYGLGEHHVVDTLPLSVLRGDGVGHRAFREVLRRAACRFYGSTGGNLEVHRNQFRQHGH